MDLQGWLIFLALTAIFWALLALAWSFVAKSVRRLPKKLGLLLSLPAGTATLHFICTCTPTSIFVRLFDSNEGPLFLRLFGLFAYTLLLLCWLVPLGFLAIMGANRFIISKIKDRWLQ